MIGKDEKQKDLEHLRRFITEQEIYGFVSHLWYSSLRAKYPFVFVELMKKYRNNNKDIRAIEYDDKKISDAIIRGHKLLLKLNKFLLHPPENEQQKIEFDRLINSLKDLLLKQNKEN